MIDYQALRAQKDEFFKSSSQSPLTREQKQNFEGLVYFSPNPAFNFETEIEEFEEQKEVVMQTTTGDTRQYTRFGKVHFEVDGQVEALTVFADDYGYFIPFVDAQAGGETYGAGRYLAPELLPDGKLALDFNLAYNPYCAYNDLYSCPLPPAENRLDVAIVAGEKKYE